MTGLEIKIHFFKKSQHSIGKVVRLKPYSRRRENDNSPLNLTRG